jgi:hypothetical protein
MQNYRRKESKLLTERKSYVILKLSFLTNSFTNLAGIFRKSATFPEIYTFFVRFLKNAVFSKSFLTNPAEIWARIPRCLGKKGEITCVLKMT